LSDTPIPGIQACVFDAYGTLFDYGSAAARYREELGDKFVPLNALWREKQLQYTWLRGLQGRHADFWVVTGEALSFAMDTLGVTDSTLYDKLMSSYLTLDTFPEVLEMLSRLRAAGVKTAILSNGSLQMLQRAVSNAGLAPLLDAILSVDEVGVFKPHPKVYQLAVDRLGVKREAISFQSSNAWDAYAASAFGMRVVWCNRYGQRPERLPGKPDRQVGSLASLPELVIPATAPEK
jgi:2-haloacid dehalogenase